ncbi:MAG: hypothetical protein V2I57_03300 [Xanthomonadales bacterium]|nr:hypothetical protein [Xanthomonadales bacterium]
MSLNPDGLGQVLIYPYYTTRNGNNTLLSVVNTTGDAKAVKVRFLEGQNSREVLDFNLYLSPYDVWTAALLDGSVVDTNCDIDNGLGLGANGQCGVPHLLTNDTTCTVPYLYLEASTAPGLQSFLPFKYVGSAADGGPTDIARAAEGHFEMIEMGVLDPAGPFAPAVDHGDVGVPANCLLLTDAWTTSSNPANNGVWIGNPLAGLIEWDDTYPSGGLFGGAAVINPSEGYMMSYDAKAINGWSDTYEPVAGSPLHARPGSELPSLNSSAVVDATVFLDDGSTLASSGLTRSVDAVSFLFMHDQIANEYSTEDDINGQTEWVVTFPTKAFYVDPAVNVNLPAFPDAADPFVQQWGPTVDSPLSTACEPVILGIVTDRTVDIADPVFGRDILISGIFDREEQSTTPEDTTRPPIVSPAPPRPPEVFETFNLCYETNIIRFGAQEVVGPTEIFGSLNFTNFDNEALGFENGWVNIEMLTYETPNGFENRGGLGGLAGLPVAGFSAQKFGNQNAQAGIAAFYGGIYQHKGTRLQSAVAAPTP